MNYIKIARLDSLPERPVKALRLLGRHHVAVWRAPEGEVHAMDVACGHQGANLLAGRRDGDIATCPRHGWRYDLRTGKCLTDDTPPLRRYPVKVEDGWVYVSLGGE